MCKYLTSHVVLCLYVVLPDTLAAFLQFSRFKPFLAHIKMNLLEYLPEHRVLCCKLCKIGLVPTHYARHLHDIHLRASPELASLNTTRKGYFRVLRQVFDHVNFLIECLSSNAGKIIAHFLVSHF